MFSCRRTHGDGHQAGPPRGVLVDAGDVVLGGEGGDVVVGVQQVDDDVGRGAEPLRRVDLDGQELKHTAAHRDFTWL